MPRYKKVKSDPVFLRCKTPGCGRTLAASKSINDKEGITNTIVYFCPRCGVTLAFYNVPVDVVCKEPSG